MQIFLFLFVGVVLGMITTSPPGLLNMNIVKINKKEGKKASYWFILAACIILLLQVCFSGYIIYRLGFEERLSNNLRKLGLVVFILLTLYFFFFANKVDSKRELKEQEEESCKKRNSFLRGLGLAAANILPIPFYLFVFSLLRSYHLRLGFYAVFAFALGAFIGTAIDFLMYIRFFDKAEKKLSLIIYNINYVIGGITGILSIITFYQVYVG